MPYKSDQQRRYFHWAAEHGKIKPSVVKEFDDASKGMKLPKRVKKNKTRRFDEMHKYLGK